MSLARFSSLFCLILLFFLVPLNVFSYETVDVSITPEGVIDAFSVSCNVRDATVILATGYPFQGFVGEYMRRPCINGIVSFDSFDLNEYLETQSGGGYSMWIRYFRPPFQIVVKDTSTLRAPDEPIFRQIQRIVYESNHYDRSLISPTNNTYPTLAVGSTFDYNGSNWFIVPPPPPPLPPEPIGDPNNLPARISSTGDVPRVSINCTPGRDYTLSLVHREGDYVTHSFGVIQRKLCGNEAVITFDGFNINTLLETRVDIEWWRYVRTPLEYIIKDTTGIFECNEYYCPLINLTTLQDYSDFSKYLASSTFWTTVGQGPVFDVDETHTVWSNLNNTPTFLAGNSNVLFFPGIMGSRLYEQVGVVDCNSGLTSNDCIRDDELWVSRLDSKHSKLVLDDNGNSINNIYTKNDTQSLNDESEKGLIDEAYGSNVYNSFITNLRNWKNEGIINDYHFIPYDWRLSLEDVITNGATTTDDKLLYTINQNFSESFILKKLEDLQKTSASGKVTFIGHSNGGLVIKALVQKLKETNNPLYEKIDKIILVAVPQVGTPDALVALLHGKSITSGVIMRNERSRELLENMPSIYNLIPSNDYFDTVDFLSATSTIIHFEDHPLFGEQISEYGFVVSNKNEMKNFVLGTDGRERPAYSDTSKPAIGNSNLYSNSEDTHILLRNFEPASTTKVIQVAGWGVETISGIDYVTRRSFGGGRYGSYRVRKVIDGDGTVVVPSALWISTSTPNVERWWVNVPNYNKDSLLSIGHGNIFEISNLREFIKSKIENNSYSDTESIVLNNSSNLVSNETRLHFTLHSPLTLGVYDSLGRFTGLDPETLEVRKEIPNVYYEQIGEVQFISAPNDLELVLKMKGLSEGSFSLDIDKQQGNTVLDSISFQGIPSSDNTIVDVLILSNMNIASSTLNIDNNGDGITDKVLEIVDKNTTVYDVTTPELSVSFDLISKDVVFSGRDDIDFDPKLTFSTTSVIIMDNQENITIIPFAKFKDKATKLKFIYNTIIRNGEVTELPDTFVVYDWREKGGELLDLDTKITMKGIERYVFSYKKNHDKTVIKKRVGNKTVTTTINGFVPVTVQTDTNLLKVEY